jgi:hypothetical protein
MPTCEEAGSAAAAIASYPSDGRVPRFCADALVAFSCARSLNLAKYSVSVSGRMPRGVGTHSRGVVGICCISRRSSHAEKRRRSGQKTLTQRIITLPAHCRWAIYRLGVRYSGNGPAACVRA